MRHLKPLTVFAMFAVLSVSLFGASATPAYAGSQGCTPGYWKAAQHHDSWPTKLGYTTSTKLSSVFDNIGSLGNDTLLQALNYKGGSTLTEAKQILLRAATAALLNAATEEISKQKLLNYPAPWTVTYLKGKVNSQLASGNRSSILKLASTLDANNNLGCPLN